MDNRRNAHRPPGLIGPATFGSLAVGQRLRFARALAALLLLATFATACLRGSGPPPPLDDYDEFLPTTIGEMREIEYLFPGADQPSMVTVEVHDGLLILEGDMIIGREADLDAGDAVGPRSLVVRGASTRWPVAPGGPPYTYLVPFVISDSFSDGYVSSIIDPAIAHWEANSNLRFVQRSDEVDYIEFEIRADRCRADVGRIGGRQVIQLDEAGCTRVGTVIHEIGHAIGLKHEHQRNDRNQHVTILSHNIEEDMAGNFTLFDQGRDVGPYDHGSIMHYGPRAFGKPDPSNPGQRLVTIQTIPPGIVIGQATVLSDRDMAAVRRIYPERDLPFVSITSPDPGPPPTPGFVVDEGVPVLFSADAVTDIFGSYSDLGNVIVSWSYERAGIPFTFGSTGSGASLSHAFCDGVHDVTATAVHTPTGAFASETVRVVVHDLGMTDPPAICAVSVSILEPLEGSVHIEGGNIPLRAVIDDDQPQISEPLYPVIWRLGDPDTGSIVGMGLDSLTKLGAGTHTIFVRYGAATDSVTITVVEQGTPPTAQITGPADGSLFTWFDHGGPGSYIDVEFSGTASDVEDGLLPGSALTWQVRREDQASFSDRGTGNTLVIRFLYDATGGQSIFAYEVRLAATDSDGMVGTDAIQVLIQSPPN